MTIRCIPTYLSSWTAWRWPFLFDIWGQPLAAANVAGLTGKPLVIYITDNNGVVTQASGNCSGIELLTHREITIQVGTPIAEIPNYTWTAQ